jgi:hypothetical protein
MELNQVIMGTTLREIQKKTDKVRLVFENKTARKSYTVTFDGILLETASPALNRRVRDVQVNNVLGFRTVSELRSHHKNPDNYRQILIRMEGSTEENKLELLGAFKLNTLNSRRSA